MGIVIKCVTECAEFSIFKLFLFESVYDNKSSGYYKSPLLGELDKAEKLYKLYLKIWFNNCIKRVINNRINSIIVLK